MFEFVKDVRCCSRRALHQFSTVDFNGAKLLYELVCTSVTSSYYHPHSHNLTASHPLRNNLKMFPQSSLPQRDLFCQHP